VIQKNNKFQMFRVLILSSRLHNAICLRRHSSSTKFNLDFLASLNPSSIASLPLTSRMAIARLGKIPPSERTSVPVPARVFVAIARTLQLEDLSAISTLDLVDLLLSLRAGIAAGGSVSLQDSAATVALASVETEIARRDDLLTTLDDDLLADIFASSLSYSKNNLLSVLAKEAARRSGSARISAKRALGCDIQGPIDASILHGPITALPDDATAALHASTRNQRTVVTRPSGQSVAEQKPWRPVTSSQKPQHWRDLAAKGFTSSLFAAVFIVGSAMAISLLANSLNKRLPPQRKMSSEDYRQFQERARERARLKVQ
jgi:hypothetical protein